MQDRMIAALAWIAVAAAPIPADDTVTVDWRAARGAIPAVVSLNGWSATDVTVATHPDFGRRLGAIRPRVLRLQASEMLRPGHAKAWIDAHGAWRLARIDRILTGVQGCADEIMVTIPRWSPVLHGAGKLPPNKVPAFAQWCADLADAVVNHQRHASVRWFEITNELDGAYNGDSPALAALVTAVSRAIRQRVPKARIVAPAWTQPYDDTDIQAFLDRISPADVQAFSYHHYGTASGSTNVSLLYDRAETIGARSAVLRSWMDVRGLEHVDLFIDETQIYASYALDTKRYMRTERGAVFLALAFRDVVEAGASGRRAATAVYPWNDADTTYGVLDPAAAFAARPPALLMQEFRSSFHGATLASATASISLVRPLAANQPGPGGSVIRRLMLVNRSNLTKRTVNVDFGSWSPRFPYYAELTIDASGMRVEVHTWRGAPRGVLMDENSIKFFVFGDV